MKGIVSTEEYVALDFSDKQAWAIVKELGMKHGPSVVDILTMVKTDNDSEGFYTSEGEKLIRLADLCSAVLDNRGDAEIIAGIKDRIKELGFFKDSVWA